MSAVALNISCFANTWSAWVDAVDHTGQDRFRVTAALSDDTARLKARARFISPSDRVVVREFEGMITIETGNAPGVVQLSFWTYERATVTASIERCSAEANASSDASPAEQ